VATCLACPTGDTTDGGTAHSASNGGRARVVHATGCASTAAGRAAAAAATRQLAATAVLAAMATWSTRRRCSAGAATALPAFFATSAAASAALALWSLTATAASACDTSAPVAASASNSLCRLRARDTARRAVSSSRGRIGMGAVVVGGGGRNQGRRGEVARQGGRGRGDRRGARQRVRAGPTRGAPRRPLVNGPSKT